MSESTVRVGVCVVAYNSATTIAGCLEACLSDPAVKKVVVIDNSSEEACRRIVEHLSVADSRVSYQGAANIGFSRGCNLGASFMLDACEYLAFVNPDVVLSKPLGNLASRLASSGKAMAAGRLTSPERPALVNARRRITMKRELLAAFLGSDRVYGITTAMLRGDGDAHAVEQLAGALVVVPKSVFVALGGFDERFELYYDDVDLCERAEALGGCVLFNDEWGHHLGGVSSTSVSEMAFCAGRVSRVRYWGKRFGLVWSTRLCAALLAVVDYSVRSLTRRREGQAARNRALRLAAMEVVRPGSVRVLG